MKKIYALILILATMLLAFTMSSCECKHRYGEWQEVKAPTCEKYGLSERTCARCGRLDTKMLRPSDNHSFGEWKIVSKPSCMNIGEEQRTCLVCGKYEGRGLPIDINAHSFGDWIVTKEPTATEKGQRERICTLCQKSEQEILFALENQ